MAACCEAAVWFARCRTQTDGFSTRSRTLAASVRSLIFAIRLESSLRAEEISGDAEATSAAAAFPAPGARSSAGAASDTAPPMAITRANATPDLTPSFSMIAAEHSPAWTTVEGPA